jgi:hypothetical protein
MDGWMDEWVDGRDVSHTSARLIDHGQIPSWLGSEPSTRGLLLYSPRSSVGFYAILRNDICPPHQVTVAMTKTTINGDDNHDIVLLGFPCG